MALTIAPLTGDALASALDDLARLRITVFRDFPYLYDGTRDNEARYLEGFAKAKDAIIVVAQEGTRSVGCATGSALAAHQAQFAAPFRAAGYDLDEIFYCGESVLLADHRGQGLGHASSTGVRRTRAKGAIGGRPSVPWCGRRIIRCGRRATDPWTDFGCGAATEGPKAS